MVLVRKYFLAFAIVQEGDACDTHRNWPMFCHGPHEGLSIVFHMDYSFYSGPNIRGVIMAPWRYLREREREKKNHSKIQDSGLYIFSDKNIDHYIPFHLEDSSKF